MLSSGPGRSALTGPRGLSRARRRANRRLLASALGLLNTANALRPFSRSGYLTAPNFVTGLPTSELPLPVLALSVARAGWTASRGGFAGRAGRTSAVLTAASWLGLVVLDRRGRRAGEPLERALVEALGPGYRDRIELPKPPGPIPSRPPNTVSMFRVRREYVRRDGTICYGPHGTQNMLDVWRHRDLPPDARAPVLLQIPGGAWVTGGKKGQAYPLLSHLASRGWVCVSMSYRLSPRHPWPAQIVDVKRALAWIKANIAGYGGDPEFVAVTGGSAGGHLAALAALSPGEPSYQPGFETTDTGVAAAVPLYGRYDWVSQHGLGRGQFMAFLERFVVQRKLDEAREVFTDASPLYRIRPDAPPMFVLHGREDSVIPVEEARMFVEKLRAVSGAPLAYAELPGAQHAFELFGSPRARHSASAVEWFLNAMWTARPRSECDPGPHAI